VCNKGWGSYGCPISRRSGCGEVCWVQVRIGQAVEEWRGMFGSVAGGAVWLGLAVEARCRKLCLVLVRSGWSRRSCPVKDRYGGSGFGG
jgi:hypothetical protein